jgi:hypothetical protein
MKNCKKNAEAVGLSHAGYGELGRTSEVPVRMPSEPGVCYSAARPAT